MSDHYKLICSAIDDIPVNLNFGVSLDDSFISVASADESDLPVSQEIVTSAPTSQDTAGFKKPRLTANVMLKEQNDGLKEQIKDLISMLKQQTPLNTSSGNDSMLSEQLALQKQENMENKQKMKELKEQIKELMNMLKHRTT
ncbi:hypothetical protein MMC12_004568 [Toensbergia leucococca]|nr:hypothetical protein [Toensbergia leucococca]